ncbi:MAG: hypothetical protein KA113_15475 [Syntrophaceae bacterium]|nr:hypothetical protein [Syntrophaceae bacterium]
MILLDDIEKLINEHGSASILRDHVALLREQIAALERENTTLKQKAIDLTSENKILKSKISEFEIAMQNKQRGQSVSEAVTKNISHDNLPEEQIDVLKLIAASITNEEKIIGAANRNTESVRFDLEELREAGLIEIERVCGFTFCNLTQNGRRYLKKSGLLT